MRAIHFTHSRKLAQLFIAAIFTLAFALPSIAEEYKALEGLNGLNTVFDVSVGDPAFANVFFWAVRDVDQNAAVRDLAKAPRTVVVFHGPVLNLITTDYKELKPEQMEETKKFQEMIRQMKKEGVTFEVCLYAAKVMNIDPARIIPEINQVGNGFIAIAGYQAKGYSMIKIP